MSYKHWLMGLFVLLLTGTALAQAEEITQPLIVSEMQIVFSWELDDIEQWLPNTTARYKSIWRFFHETSLSPLNNEIAYYGGRYIVIERNTDGGTYSGKYPGDLELINPIPNDLATSSASPIEEAPFYRFNRSDIMWSPDGMQLAWTQGLTTGDTMDYGLLIHDRTTGTTRFVATLPPELSPYGAPPGIWTDQGIVIDSDSYDYENKISQHKALVFDPVTGQQRFAVPVLLQGAEESISPRKYMPVQHQGKTSLALLYIEGDNTLLCQWIDLETGIFEECPALPVALIEEHAETSLRVIPLVVGFERLGYSITEADGTPVSLSKENNWQAASFALSPDGSAVAFIAYDLVEKDTLSDMNLLVWRDGIVTPIPKGHPTWYIGSPVWSTATWVFADDAPSINLKEPNIPATGDLN